LAEMRLVQTRPSIDPFNLDLHAAVPLPSDNLFGGHGGVVEKQRLLSSCFLLSALLLAACVSHPARGAEPTNETRVVTNLVEVLEYINAFSKTLGIDMPQPLTTNAITWSSPYRTGGDGIGLHISKSFGFGFNSQYHFVNYFDDRRYSMTALWREEDIKPLIRPSKMSAKQAVEMARDCLVKLGYTGDKLPPLLPPTVHQWKWKPPGAWLGEPLPFFTVEWCRKGEADIRYCHIEIDGLRQKITNFFIMYPH
jgi:hypothetical protein